jgi:two-component system sensor histidine kinase and response regulator WspE
MSDSDNFGDDSLFELFREEAETQVASLTEALLALESGGDDDAAMLEQIMRAAHSMKGAARIIGIDPLVELTHAMEDLFVAAIAGEVELRPPLIDLALQCTDFIVDIAKGDATGLSSQDQQLTALMGLLADARAGRELQGTGAPLSEAVSSPTVAEATNSQEDEALGDASMMALFRDEMEQQLSEITDALVALDAGEEPRPLLEALMRGAHSLKGAARIVNLDSVGVICHELETLFVAALASELEVTPTAADIVFGAIDYVREVAAGGLQLTREQETECEELLERLANFRSGKAPAQPTVDSANNDGQVQRVERPMPASTPPRGGSTGGGGRSIRMTAETLERLTGLAAESVVEADRFARLMDEMSTLHQAQRTLDGALELLRQRFEFGHVNSESDQELRNELNVSMDAFDVFGKRLAERDAAFEDFGRRSAALARRLSRESLESRMLPFGSILRGFPRLVRDVTRSLGKRCRLELRGDGTLVDREMLEQLEAPLNHLVRNALDHGMEAPDARVAAGKPEEGGLTIESFHRAGRLQIVIRDDGRGIDAEALRQRIVDRGLESAENAAQLADDELREFLFLPGFSTAQKVTDLSGRGVGLDAVRTMVQEAGGAVVVDSEPGQGTAFTLDLPVTRTVVRALMTTICEEPYALPLAGIVGVVQVEPNDLTTIEGHPCFEHEGANVSIVAADEILGLPVSEQTSDGLLSIVLVEKSGHVYGLKVDAFDGERKLVVRPTDPRLGDVPNVEAVSTDEQGQVVIILDIAELVRSIDSLVKGGRRLGLRTLASSAANQSKRKHILVVDDSLTVRETERQMLENCGYAVDVAVDGVDGWNAVGLGGYDLVVSDVDMPRMNGIELVKRIRADTRLQDLPVVIVSYKDREADRMRGLEAGATCYLTKAGFQDDALVNVVEDLIGAAQS